MLLTGVWSAILLTSFSQNLSHELCYHLLCKVYCLFRVTLKLNFVTHVVHYWEIGVLLCAWK